jgi:MerR family copper efflux transcriptional regulator
VAVGGAAPGGVVVHCLAGRDCTGLAGALLLRRNVDTGVVTLPGVNALTVGEAAARSGWSPRMLRYLERTGLVVPARKPSGYRLYGVRELNQLRSLRDLRDRFGVAIADVAFAAQLRREPRLRAAVETWLTGSGIEPASANAAWVDWEQRKHERLLAA